MSLIIRLRCLAEHVGSKTAVQIRSHAQKFFAKLGRDQEGGEKGGGLPAAMASSAGLTTTASVVSRRTLEPQALRVACNRQNHVICPASYHSNITRSECPLMRGGGIISSPKERTLWRS